MTSLEVRGNYGVYMAHVEEVGEVGLFYFVCPKSGARVILNFLKRAKYAFSGLALQLESTANRSA